MSDHSLPEDVVAALPRRTAHALYALTACARSMHGSGPFFASEIVLYDPEAVSALATGAGLAHARKHGLADNTAGLWWATSLGNSLWRHLEARVLDEQLQEESKP